MRVTVRTLFILGVLGLALFSTGCSGTARESVQIGTEEMKKFTQISNLLARGVNKLGKVLRLKPWILSPLS